MIIFIVSTSSEIRRKYRRYSRAIPSRVAEKHIAKSRVNSLARRSFVPDEVSSARNVSLRELLRSREGSRAVHI